MPRCYQSSRLEEPTVEQSSQYRHPQPARTPAVSIVLCTRNGDRHLVDQLESILGQTWKPNEILIGDDMSSDRTRELLLEFERSHSSIRLVFNDQRLGVTRNFERCLAASRGEVIFLSDQDDFWRPHKVEFVMSQFLRSPDTLCVLHDAEIADERLRLLGTTLWDTIGFRRDGSGRQAINATVRGLIKHNVAYGSTLAVRSSLLSIALPIAAGWGHDSWIALCGATAGQVRLVPDCLSVYRQHSGQETPDRLLRQRAPMTHDFRSSLAKRRQDFLLLSDHLAAVLPAATIEECLSELKQVAAHFDRRSRLPHRHLARLPLVLREAASGRYQKYTDWKSVVRDLVMTTVPRQRGSE